MVILLLFIALVYSSSSSNAYAIKARGPTACISETDADGDTVETCCHWETESDTETTTEYCTECITTRDGWELPCTHTQTGVPSAALPPTEICPENPIANKNGNCMPIAQSPEESTSPSSSEGEGNQH